MEKKGRIIGLKEGIIESTLDALISQHKDIGVQIFYRNKEEVLADVDFKNMPDNKDYGIIKLRMQEYIAKNFHGADGRCFPGSLANGHREKVLDYVKKAFE